MKTTPASETSITSNPREGQVELLTRLQEMIKTSEQIRARVMRTREDAQGIRLNSQRVRQSMRKKPSNP